MCSASTCTCNVCTCVTYSYQSHNALQGLLDELHVLMSAAGIPTTPLQSPTDFSSIPPETFKPSQRRLPASQQVPRGSLAVTDDDFDSRLELQEEAGDSLPDHVSDSLPFFGRGTSGRVLSQLASGFGVGKGRAMAWCLWRVPCHISVGTY